ncbi:hypothetical protein J41TS12_26810 [Paenibacillus antibioticophila]|uniref:Uncharacterized protein n=1 Tax=Paenibacillus antibioticophila TaxID=1274374 RepID=A0A919XWT3_9BACL|nr:hypothetical protein [Paenibacillus antibioticophila]GIO37820.1 hypothetical protein J41TS12_26810 [Paenibacillus antibioticophila]
MQDRKDLEKELERELSEMLSDQVVDSEEERLKKERSRLAPKYEVRIQTQLDPIVEETLKYRSMGKEIDGRYDAYLKRAGVSDRKEEN